MVHIIAVQGQLSGKEYLQAYIWGVITVETGKRAEAVDDTRTYRMWVRLQNTYRNNWQSNPANYDDKWWYLDINLRVVPQTDGIQVYSGANFQTPGPRVTFYVDKLQEQQYRWFPVYFKWTKSTAKDVNDLEFKMGLYAHEIERVRHWRILKP